MNSKKFIAGMIVSAMAVAFVPTVQAATAEELAAQITALQSQLVSLQGQLGTGTGTTTTTTTTGTTTSVAACAGISFTRNLTLGSTGTDVKCLQALLNGSADTAVATTGVGSAGNETVNFGGLTKAAVIKFQNKFAAEVLTPVGLTAGTGFVGAQTRVKLNAMLAGTTTTTTTDTDDTTTTTTTTTTTKDGEEGDFVVSLNSTPSNNQDAEEGKEAVAVMGIKIKATGSDIDIQRATLAFDKKPYNYFSNVYLYDGSTVVAEVALDSDSVSKVDSTDYRVTVSSFENKFVVAEGATKVLTVKVDVKDSVDADELNDTVAILLPTDSAIRGVDEAGLNQYGGGTDVTRNISMAASAADDATLTLSTNDDTPLDRNVIADNDGNIEDAVLTVFDVEAEDDDMTITDINDVVITRVGSTDYPDTVYLLNGSNEVIAEASGAATVDFEDLEETITDGDTETFTIKFDYDVENAAHFHAGMTFTADVANAGIVAENSEEDKVVNNGTANDVISGSATGNEAIIYQVGPMFSITSISTSSSEPESASSTISAIFKVVVEAVGGDIYLAAKSDGVSSFNVISTVDDATPGSDASSITYTKPTGVTQVTGTAGNILQIEEDESITFTVNATKTVSDAGYYDLRMDSIFWTTNSTNPVFAEFTESTYMSGETGWISDAEYLQ